VGEPTGPTSTSIKSPVGRSPFSILYLHSLHLLFKIEQMSPPALLDIGNCIGLADRILLEFAVPSTLSGTSLQQHSEFVRHGKANSLAQHWHHP
jgi:hypothetical protein